MSKRGENIYKRKDGRWEARYPKGYAENGSIVYGYVYGHSYAEAKSKKNKKIAERPKVTKYGKSAYYNNITFRQVADEWLEKKRLGIKESTYVRYRGLLTKHLLPFFGAYRIDALEEESIRAFCRQKSGHGALSLSPKTLQDTLSVLRLVMRYAEEQYFLPAGQLQIRGTGGNLSSDEKSIAVMPAAERTRFEQYLSEQADGDVRCLGILLALYTGLRIGELCALRWGDIDRQSGILYVNHTLQRLRDFGTPQDCGAKTKLLCAAPKTRSSRRAIPLPQFLLDKLNDPAADAEAEYYFLSGTAKAVEPRSCLYHYKKHLKKCGLPDYTFHALRHTFATRCIEEGFDVKSLSEILGHSNVKITMDRYVHPSMEAKRAQMERLSPRR